MSNAFPDNLKRLMKSHDIGATELARTLGIGRQTVYNWFTGVLPRQELTSRLAEVFGVAPSELLYGGDALDTALLAQCLSAIEDLAAELKIELTSSKKARLVSILYAKRKSGDQISSKDLSELIALAA